ncbi:MAG: DUF1365 family protein [Acidimicrobiales bacterium]
MNFAPVRGFVDATRSGDRGASCGRGRTPRWAPAPRVGPPRAQVSPRRATRLTLSLRRRTLDCHGLARLLWEHPASTHRVSAGIYSQAARLCLRGGAPFHAHPARS